VEEVSCCKEEERERERMPSLFIDNLPQGFTSHELRELFGNHRYIVDVYVPPIQRNRVNGRFGFIKVQAREEGERLIQRNNGRKAGHKVIKVDWAKYPRRLGNSKGINLPIGEDKLWRGGYKNHPASSSQTKRSSRVIRLETVEENFQWLERSLTCCSELPRDVDSLKSWITENFQEKIEVRELGHFKFLLTMESKELKNWIKIEGKERLEKWFYSINDWTERDVCQTRRIWLEIVGLPLQFWSETNIRRLAANWGDVVLVEKETSTLESGASAKVLIDTLSMQQIEEEVIIQDENKGFKVFVFEAKIEFSIFHFDSPGKRVAGMAPLEYSDKEGKQNVGSKLDDGNRQVDLVGVQSGGGEGQQRTGGVLFSNSNSKSNSLDPRGVGILRGTISAAATPFNEMDVTREECASVHIEADAVRVLDWEPAVMKEAEGGNEGGPMADAFSQASVTRTLTAELSGNNFSEEVTKVNQLLKRNTQATQEDGFDGEATQSQNKAGLDHSDNISIPPGFENTATKTGRAKQKGKSTSRKGKSGEVKRFTRSQLRRKIALNGGFTRSQLRKKVALNGGARTKAKSELLGRRNSIETTDSMKQTAEEALQVGELLGVKVISHPENAIKRITDTLKASRV